MITPTAPGRALRRADFPTLIEALDYAAQGETGLSVHGQRGELVEALSYADRRAAALDLAGRTIDLFWDDKDCGLFYTGRDAETLVNRSKHMMAGAEPSANGMAALGFAKLATLCERADLGEKADIILRAYQPLVEAAPRGLGAEAVAAAWRTGPVKEVGVVGIQVRG